MTVQVTPAALAYLIIRSEARLAFQAGFAYRETSVALNAAAWAMQQGAAREDRRAMQAIYDAMQGNTDTDRAVILERANAALAAPVDDVARLLDLANRAEG